MNPKRLLIPFFLLLLVAMGTTASAQRFRSVGYSGGSRLPGGGYGGHGYYGGGGRFYGGGYGGYRGGYGGYRGYYGGYRGYYGGWGGYRPYYGGWGFGFGLGLGLGFGYPYGYYGYPYSPYYSPYGYPPVAYAQPPVVVQRQGDDYYDPNSSGNAPDDPYRDDNSGRNYYDQQQPSQQQQSQQQPSRQQPADDNYDYSRPVNPDSLTYKPGTNLTPRSNSSTRDKVWVKPHWKHTGDGWIWIDGYWK